MNSTRTMNGPAPDCRDRAVAPTMGVDSSGTPGRRPRRGRRRHDSTRPPGRSPACPSPSGSPPVSGHRRRQVVAAYEPVGASAADGLGVQALGHDLGEMRNAQRQARRMGGDPQMQQAARIMGDRHDDLPVAATLASLRATISRAKPGDRRTPSRQSRSRRLASGRGIRSRPRASTSRARGSAGRPSTFND